MVNHISFKETYNSNLANNKGPNKPKVGAVDAPYVSTTPISDEFKRKQEEIPKLKIKIKESKEHKKKRRFLNTQTILEILVASIGIASLISILRHYIKH